MEGELAGRYQLIELIGAGGMGRVYRAFDPQLDRFIALKVIRGSVGASAEALLREARLQARVEHEAVCKIFEVGELDGEPYIAMQLIQGRTLEDERAGLSLEQRVQVMATVARAVHEAHRVGLIHLDLKPKNVMLERRTGGAWRPFVLDFGIAREAGDAPSAEGGTPKYMAPEQSGSCGARVDHRADIYALGAVLLELIGAEPSSDELAAIASRCTAVEMHERYPSALALAEDLERYLDGGPVDAVQGGAGYRLRKRIVKHRIGAALSAAALLALLALGGTWWLERSSARRQVELAKRFGQRAEELEARVRFARMLPLHDVTRELEEVRRDVRGLMAEVDRAEGPGLGPGHHAIGRALLAIGDVEAARAHLMQAWAAGYRSPPVAAAIGVALGLSYEAELARARTAPDRDPRVQADLRSRIDRELLSPALEFLEQGIQDEAEPLAAALLAFYRGDDARALAECLEARRRRPWAYEALILAGRIHAEAARRKAERGDQRAAAGARSDAMASFEAAATIARSSADAYALACRTAADEVFARTYHLESDPAEPHAAAVEACQRALIADPGRPSTFAELSRAHKLLAIDLMAHDRDPLAALEASASAAEHALGADPDDPQALNSLGNVYRIRAESESKRGLESAASLLKAKTLLERAAASAPGLPYIWNNLGRVHADLGSFERALDCYQRAIAIDPEHASPYVNAAAALIAAGETARAQPFLARGLELNPSDAYAHGLEQRLAALRR